MDTIQHIIIDHTLARIGDSAFADYLCHAYCYGGYCTFERPRVGERSSGMRNNTEFRFEAGDCMITPQSNYGMRGQLSLFQNTIMKLTPEQQEVFRH